MPTLSRGYHNLKGGRGVRFREGENELRTHRMLEQNIGGKGSAADWRLIQKSNLDGTEIATSVATGPASFHLGTHDLGSAAQNVVFVNSNSLLSFFPVWQGISVDGNTIVPASVRRYGPITESETLGPVSDTGQVDYNILFVSNSELEFYNLTIVPAEDFDGKLFWGAWDSNGDMVHRQAIETPAEIDVPLTVDFHYPLSTRSGNEFSVRIFKIDDSNLKVRPSSSFPDEPYRKTTLRPFFDDPSMMPIGTTIDWYGDVLGLPMPAGFWPCDGTTISAFYSPLDGIDAPDLRTQFLAGAGSTSATEPGDTQNIFTLNSLGMGLVTSVKRYVTKLIKI